jgi:hypothetical protein
MLEKDLLFTLGPSLPDATRDRSGNHRFTLKFAEYASQSNLGNP